MFLFVKKISDLGLKAERVLLFVESGNRDPAARDQVFEKVVTDITLRGQLREQVLVNRMQVCCRVSFPAHASLGK